MLRSQSLESAFVLSKNWDKFSFASSDVGNPNLTALWGGKTFPKIRVSNAQEHMGHATWSNNLRSSALEASTWRKPFCV